MGCGLSLREGRKESGAGLRPHHNTSYPKVHPVLPHFGPMPTLESHHVLPTTHSLTQTSNPALPTPSTRLQATRSKPPMT